MPPSAGMVINGRSMMSRFAAVVPVSVRKVAVSRSNVRSGASVECGGDEPVAQWVRSDLLVDSSGLGDAAHDPGGGVLDGELVDLDAHRASLAAVAGSSAHEASP